MAMNELTLSTKQTNRCTAYTALQQKLPGKKSLLSYHLPRTKQQGLYNTPTKKVLGLLQWMESSAGKTRISSKRGGAVIPAFNLLPP